MKLEWFTPGLARFVLIVWALATILIGGIALAVVTDISPALVYGAIVNAAMLVLGALLNAAGARQMADAKEAADSPPAPTPPPAPTGT